METIKILHASDLHIATHPLFQSPVDKLKEIDIKDWSQQGVWEKFKIPSEFTVAWWKKMAASSYNPEILRSLAEYIYLNAKRKINSKGEEITANDASLDAVVLTGDLATTGNENDIQLVWKFLNSPYNPKYPHKSNEESYRGGTLSAIRIPVLILPGNHDRYIPTKEVTTVLLKQLNIVPKYFNVGGDNFDRHLLDYLGEPIKTLEITRDIAGGNSVKIIILAADFTLRNFNEHEGFLGWLAQGKVHEDVLEKLVEKTQSFLVNKNEHEVIHIFWACHFPPRFPNVKNHSKLINEEKLIKKANELGVKAILGGHTHQQVKYNTPSMSMNCEVLCCGSTTQHEPQTMPGGKNENNPEVGNFFQILSIKTDADGYFQLDVEHYRYSSTEPIRFLMGQQVAPNLLLWKRCQL